MLGLGMVATATRTLLENLDRIPNEDSRTKVSILAFDTSLYFFSIQVCYPPSSMSFPDTLVARIHRIDNVGSFRYRRRVPAKAQ